MEDLYEFLCMDGYAWYVWSSYGISFAVLLLNILIPVKREEGFLNKLCRLNSEQ